MFALPKSDPLDVLVYGIGLRLTQLAKMGDPKFKKLLENRNFTIQMGSESQDVYRTFTVENGRFRQAEGKAVNPTLTIDFKDSMTGAKLLTKGDATAFMSGIQNGDVKMSGDYSLLMWFNQVAKHIVPKVPEQLQPAMDMAKPLISKATPLAKDLCDKAMSLLAGFGILGGTSSKPSDKDESKSKYFSEKSDENTKEKVGGAEKSLIDAAKEKLADVKADVEEKVGELKDKAEEKFAEVKDKAEGLTNQAKDKVAEVKEVASEKVEQVKSDAETKVADVKEKAEDLTTQVKDKVAEVKEGASEKVDTAKDKVEDVKIEATEKLATIKTQVADKVDTVKEKTDDLTSQAKDKVAEVKDNVETKPENLQEHDETLVDRLKSDYQIKQVSSKSEATKAEQKSETPNATSTPTQSKFDELLEKVESEESENLTPAIQKSHELEAKHADDKVIAENIETDAVKDDKSPITNVSVTKKA